MPFTFDGQRIPKESKQKPVKVHLVKRKQSVLTVISGLALPEKEIVELASKMKKKLGCGGAVKGSDIEIQGDKIDPVKKILEEFGIPFS